MFHVHFLFFCLAVVAKVQGAVWEKNRLKATESGLMTCHVGNGEYVTKGQALVTIEWMDYDGYGSEESEDPNWVEERMTIRAFKTGSIRFLCEEYPVGTEKDTNILEIIGRDVKNNDFRMLPLVPFIE
jgi:hypothetical protein